MRTLKNNNFLHYCMVLLVFFSALSCRNEAKPESPEKNKQAEEGIAVEPEKTDEKKRVENLIQVNSPQPNTKITSPLQIKGKARGTWYFEGDFPVRLLDKQGKEIAVAIAIAQGEWMTEEWVEFTATMEFEASTSGNGVLVFEKSNPSDNRELDRELRVPVKL